MLQQKYVRGSFLLEENVDDSKVYYEQHKAKVDEVIAWANQLHISYVAFQQITLICANTKFTARPHGCVRALPLN